MRRVETGTWRRNTRRLCCVVAAFLGIVPASSAVTAPPDEAVVQGLYEGTWKDAAGSLPAEVRVVALGGRKFTLMARRTLADGRIDRAEMTGQADGDTIAFAGDAGNVAWKAVYADGAIKGSTGDTGALDIRRVERKPPSLGQKPPAGAVVLLDGRNFAEVERKDKAPWHVGDMSKDGLPVWEVGLQFSGEKEPSAWPTPQQPLPAGWVIAPARRTVETVVGVGPDGSMVVPKGGLFSVRSFDGSYDLHVEFMCNFAPGSRSQARGNSGVYLHNGQEIQVLDSFGMATYPGGGCGGLYFTHKDPDGMEPILGLRAEKENSYTLASLPPLQWQTYDIAFRVRKDDKGRPGGFLTVVHNGVTIHDAVPMNPAKGKIHVQDHGNPVRYRNIWIAPVDQ